YNFGEKTTGPNPVPRFSLIRRQKLLVPHKQPNGTDINQVQNPVNPQFPILATQMGQYAEVSCLVNPDPTMNQYIYFNHSNDITIPQRRFGMNANGLPSGQANNPGYYGLISADDPTKSGSDLLLTDVLSFQIMPLVKKVDLTTTPPTITNTF